MHYEKHADGTVKCIEDEIPFDMPEGWEWSRLGSISTTIQYGLSNSAENSGTHRLLRITDIQNGEVKWDKVPFTTVDEPDAYLLSINDIVFARTGATVGKSFLIRELPYEAVYASYLIRIRLTNGLLPEYLYQFFNSQNYWEQITSKAVGVGQPNCNGTSLRELLIPIPPFGEQYRIVPAASSLLTYAEMIDKNQNDISELIGLAKGRILDLAIRGQLVPQNSDDEPASVLLDHIRVEKEALIKQGKIKRDKRESIIFRGDDNSYYERVGTDVVDITEELPFPIPETWCWARMSTLFEINPRNKLDDSLEVSFIPMPLIEDGYSGNHGSEKRKWSEVRTGFTHFVEGDIGIAKITPCFENRKSVVFQNLTNGFGAGTTELHVLRPYGKLILPEYALALAKTKAFIEDGKQEFTGAVGQQRIGKDFISEYLFPIPPYQEQIRIVNAIEQIFHIISVIEQSIG